MDGFDFYGSVDVSIFFFKIDLILAVVPLARDLLTLSYVFHWIARTFPSV